jgi:hypothetical protein
VSREKGQGQPVMDTATGREGLGGGVAQDALGISINLTHDCSLARAWATFIAYRMKIAHIVSFHL